MISPQRKTVYLSFISTDLPVWNIIEAKASLYQKDRDRFHLLLNQTSEPNSETSKQEHSLLWLEISPSQVVMTMQSPTKSYRHYWELGIYGYSRYWLNNSPTEDTSIGSLRLRNYTRHLKIEGSPFPHTLQIEYELWSSFSCKNMELAAQNMSQLNNLQMGSYFWHLNINH